MYNSFKKDMLIEKIDIAETKCLVFGNSLYGVRHFHEINISQGGGYKASGKSNIHQGGRKCQ